jgi:hypothetical protein
MSAFGGKADITIAAQNVRFRQKRTELARTQVPVNSFRAKKGQQDPQPSLQPLLPGAEQCVYVRKLQLDRALNRKPHGSPNWKLRRGVRRQLKSLFPSGIRARQDADPYGKSAQ